jgi:ketosteroid isomerase-like protein
MVVGRRALTPTPGKAIAMGAQENKQTAQAAYEAFSGGDAEGAMRNIDDSIEWTVRGENALTGTHKGKQAVGELWGKLAGTGFRTDPHHFIAEDDKVVVLTTVHLQGETGESADVLTYNGNGKLIAFDTLGDPSVTNRVFAV